jgi:S1-C subfamily serine protease
VCVVLLASLAACGTSAGDEAAGRGGVGASGPGASPSDGPNDAALDAARGSIAQVSTPLGRGTAVLLEDGHLLTASHVVDPHARVDVRFDDGEVLEGVEVIGVDLVADVAVLGPVASDRPPLRVGVVDDVAIDDRVFAVGFPGERADDDPEVRGGVRTRDLRIDHFELDYVRSDVLVAPGQSGGPLVDGAGRWIGMITDEEETGNGWALAIDDALVAAEGILAGGGTDAWQPLPRARLETEHAVPAGPDEYERSFYVPAQSAADDVEVEIAVEGADPMVVVADVGWSWTPFEANEAALGNAEDLWNLDDTEPLREVRPGAWAFDLPAGTDAVISIASAQEGSLVVSTSVEVEAVDPVVPAGSIRVGQTQRIVLARGEESHLISLDLVEGEQVQIAVRSAGGDPAWWLWPDAGDEPVGQADDGGGGVRNLDAIDLVTAPATGSYLLEVADYGTRSRVVELSVTPA